LYFKNQPIDLFTISGVLQENGQFIEIGMASYLTNLLNSWRTAANPEYYHLIVDLRNWSGTDVHDND
jgi:replicative DNA helicase